MKNRINLNWNIYNEVIDREERYCPACGKKVVFRDSLIRRQNANGKNIYHFAIYKCEKDHTWNKQLGIFKALSGLENNPQINENRVSDYEVLNLENYLKEGIEFININIQSINSKERLDRFISDKLSDFSRNEINQIIKKGAIKINEDFVKPNRIIRVKDKISVEIQILNDMFNLKEENKEHKVELVFDYKNNEKLRKSFNELSQSTFGINFEEWFQKKMWNDRYECYSIKADGKIVSNASVNKFKFLIKGKKKKALQIGTVMTHKAYRNKGMAKEIINFILEKFENEYDVIYLFANNSVLDFYPKFGFRKMAQKQLYTNEKIEKNSIYNFRKLDMDNLDDVFLLKEIAVNRIPNAESFDVIGGHEVLFWYFLNVFRDNIYYDENKNVVVIYTVDGDRLNIHDIVLRDKKDYRGIIGSLASENINEISFDFNIEADNINICEKDADDEDNVLFVKGDLDKNISFIHPVTAPA